MRPVTVRVPSGRPWASRPTLPRPSAARSGGQAQQGDVEPAVRSLEVAHEVREARAPHGGDAGGLELDLRIERARRTILAAPAR